MSKLMHARIRLFGKDPSFWVSSGALRLKTFDDKIVLPKIVESLRYEVATFLNPTFELV